MFRHIRSKLKTYRRERQASDNDSSPTEHKLVEDEISTPENDALPPEGIDQDAQNLPIVVAAIDFGTSYTGYAFSFQHDCTKILTSTHGGKLMADKVPTTILLKPDKTFHSFGFEAEDKYASLAESDNHKDWFIFPGFKMALYRNTSLKRETEIFDNEGRPMAAMKVLSMAIAHIQEIAVDIICKSKDGIVNRDIKWMITIPAIWSDSARQFMREAAIIAGISWDRLNLVLEPEAASLFCKEQNSQKIGQSSSGAVMLGRFPIGHKYILADLGGGTADICVHEIIANGFLREIYRTTGGDLGGTSVDVEFRQFMIKLFGADIFMKFKNEFMDNYSSLLREFERKKNVFTVTTEHVVLSLPASLVELVKSELMMTIEDIIPNTRFPMYLVFKPKQNKLVINRKIIEEFFKQSLEGIINLLREILQETRDHNIQTLLMVGGYSESPYLREIIQSEMTGLTLLLEPEARLAVLKGAVLIGYKPRTIVERRAQFTYGFSFIAPFIEGEHPEKLKIVHDGQEYCSSLFRKQIEKGHTLIYGQVFKSRSLNHSKTKKSKHQTVLTQLFKSSRVNPEYCTEGEGCTKVGEIEIKPPESGWPDVVKYETDLVVGESEFTVNVIDLTTAAEYETKTEFL